MSLATSRVILSVSASEAWEQNQMSSCYIFLVIATYIYFFTYNVSTNLA